MSAKVKEQRSNTPATDAGQKAAPAFLGMVDARSVERADFQPEARDGNQKTNVAIRRSVRELGVLTPLLIARVDGRLVVADGHRRLQAALEAGLAEVPAAVYEGVSPATLYLAQFTSRRPCGSETCQVWLIDASAVPKAIARGLASFERRVGRDRLVAYIQAGASPYSFKVIGQVAHYLGGKWETDDAHYARLADWCILKKNRLAASKYITWQGGTKAALERAVKHGKTLKIGFEDVNGE